MIRVGTIVRWGAAIAIGAVVGVVTVWWATGPSHFTAVPGHPEWLHGDSAGATNASPYARAAVARHGLLALRRPEAMYYGALYDRHKRHFDAACTYEITGSALPARWWALTIYADDGFLPHNDDDANHVGSADVVAAPDGSWKIRMAPTRDGAANWLSTRGSGHFDISLRMYQPDPAVFDGKAPDLPVIHRVSCPHGGRT